MKTRVIVGTEFQLKLTILIFWTKFAQKGCFCSKTEKVNTTIDFCIFELVYLPNFSLNWQFWFFFLSKFAQKGYLRSKTKKPHLCVRSWSLLTMLTFRTGPDRYNSILKSLLLLIVETISGRKGNRCNVKLSKK